MVRGAKSATGASSRRVLVRPPGAGQGKQLRPGDRTQYSVPSRHTGQIILAKAYVDRIDFLAGSEIVVSHTRCYKRGEVRMEIGHYLTALERKPHAVTNTAVVRQLPPVFGRLREHMTKGHSHGYKDFLLVLLLLREYTLSELTMALESVDVIDIHRGEDSGALVPGPRSPRSNRRRS